MSTDHGHSALRARLSRELEALAEAEQETADQRRPVALDQQSVGRLSRMDALERQAMAKATAERMRRQRARLKAAIARIDAAVYGECARCGEVIEPERLEFDPTAPFCAGCAADPRG